jgi:hypothetical protein
MATFILMPNGDLRMQEDPVELVDGTVTRVTLMNAAEDALGPSTISHRTEEGEVVVDTTVELEPGAFVRHDVVRALGLVELTARWPALDALVVHWALSDLTAGSPGQAINVYAWTEGDCTAESADCQPALLGVLPSGYTFPAGYTTDPGFGWEAAAAARGLDAGR